jgi:hypothetical protein
MFNKLQGMDEGEWTLHKISTLTYFIVNTLIGLLEILSGFVHCPHYLTQRTQKLAGGI